MEGLMKKALVSALLLIGVVFLNQRAMADDFSNERISACLLGMPPVILISQDMRDLNFSKSPLVDAFWNYESVQKGKGFSQQYENSFCRAKMTLYHDNQGRLSNNKVLRELKDKTTFPFLRQRNLKTSGVKFYGAYGQDEDVSNTLLLANFKNYFLRLRVMCSVLPRFSAEEYERKIDDMTTILTEGIVEALDTCL